ncbi:MAG: hypothetical protein IJA82_04640 [Clostridia bacterium]|nr:hypothetical protein [Clostridia bacterium]
MKSIEEIKIDLTNDVLFYYAIKPEAMKEMKNDPVLVNGLFKRVEAYEKAIKNAPLSLQAIFDYLYRKGLTQKEASSKMGISQGYASKLNGKLLAYLQENI